MKNALGYEVKEPLMLTTKRYDYINIEAIRVHPSISNHRPLNQEKVRHYAEDIEKNGLLEPLIVWERNYGEYFLVGGFHRMNAIQRIRSNKPGYFDRIDVRVVAGDVDEMRALNLKLNADRLDARVSEYFDTVIYLNNANWDKERLAAFFDRSISWIEEIVRYVPGMDPRLRKMLDEGTVSWAKARNICKEILQAAPGSEKETADRLLDAFLSGERERPAPKPLTVRGATRNLAKHIERGNGQKYTLDSQDLYALLVVLSGKKFEDHHVDRVRRQFPILFGANS